jgi:hypothetical protein
MAKNQLSKGPVLAHSIQLTAGEGVTIDEDGISVGGTAVSNITIVRGTVSVNPPSIAATTRAAVDVTVAGVVATDIVIAEPPAALNDDLIYCGVVAGAGKFTVSLYNTTAGPVDDSARTWTYKIIRAV